MKFEKIKMLKVLKFFFLRTLMLMIKSKILFIFLTHPSITAMTPHSGRHPFPNHPPCFPCTRLPNLISISLLKCNFLSFFVYVIFGVWMWHRSCNSVFLCLLPVYRRRCLLMSSVCKCAILVYFLVVWKVHE